ncbi:MAG TPA: hypothetical protein VGE94_19865 [Chloroflexota bacterium]
MRVHQRLSFWITLLLILGMVAAIWGAAGFRAEARAFPVGVATLTLVVLVIVLLGEFFPKVAGLFEISLEDVAGSEARAAEDMDDERPAERVLVRDVPWAIIGLVFGSLIVFAVCVLLIGFTIAAPIYVLLFLRLYGGAGWGGSAFLAAAVTGIMIGLSTLMRVDLFPGVLSIPGLHDGAPLPPF